MARVSICGFESGSLDGEDLCNSPKTNTGSGYSGAVSIESGAGLFRSGAYSLKLAPASSTLGYWHSDGASNAANVYIRFYVRVTTLPSATRALFSAGSTAGSNTPCVALKSDGTLELRNGAIGGTLYGTSTAALSDSSAWYCIELKVLSNDWELRIDGTSEVTTAAVGVTGTALYWGATDATVAATYTAYIDDIVIDDAAYPGPGKVVMLRPTSDNSAGSWRAGSAANASANGALYDAINNSPPHGKATPNGVTDCISNAISGMTNPNGDFNMTTYTAAGIGSSDTINAVSMVIIHGEDISTNSKTGNFKIVSNPDSGTAVGVGGYQSAVFGPAAGGAVGTYPSNWIVEHGTVVQTPSVTLGTAPVARITKTDTGTRAADCCFMGIYVDYTPGGPSTYDKDATASAASAFAVANLLDALGAATASGASAISATGGKEISDDVTAAASAGAGTFAVAKTLNESASASASSETTEAGLGTFPKSATAAAASSTTEVGLGTFPLAASATAASGLTPVAPGSFAHSATLPATSGITEAGGMDFSPAPVALPATSATAQPDPTGAFPRSASASATSATAQIAPGAFAHSAEAAATSGDTRVSVLDAYGAASASGAATTDQGATFLTTLIAELLAATASEQDSTVNAAASTYDKEATISAAAEAAETGLLEILDSISLPAASGAGTFSATKTLLDALSLSATSGEARASLLDATGAVTVGGASDLTPGVGRSLFPAISLPLASGLSVDSKLDAAAALVAVATASAATTGGLILNPILAILAASGMLLEGNVVGAPSIYDEELALATSAGLTESAVAIMDALVAAESSASVSESGLVAIYAAIATACAADLGTPSEQLDALATALLEAATEILALPEGGLPPDWTRGAGRKLWVGRVTTRASRTTETSTRRAWLTRVRIEKENVEV